MGELLGLGETERRSLGKRRNTAMMDGRNSGKYF
jgi:hypothetical protein